MIKKPTLLLDKGKCCANIRMMAAKCRKNGLFFRPHFKTHQSRIIGSWFRESGIEGITVSSVNMAEYFAADGWDDITIAFPFNRLEIEEVNRLNDRIRLNLLLQEIESTAFLERELNRPAGFFLKIDTGYHRAGIGVDDIDSIKRLLTVTESCSKLGFRGFLTHSGHTYRAESVDEIRQIHAKALGSLKQLKKQFTGKYPDLILSVGDTPSCSLAEDFEGVDEIRPGNFVFYDLMQLELGSCNFDQIALIAACPVVAKNPGRREVIIYGGAVHLSKELLMIEGDRNFGLIVRLSDKGWSRPCRDSYVSALSQEHGIVKMNKENFEQTQIGEILGIVPVHSCLTACAIGEYRTFEGEEIDHM